MPTDPPKQAEASGVQGGDKADAMKPDHKMKLWLRLLEAGFTGQSAHAVWPPIARMRHAKAEQILDDPEKLNAFIVELRLRGVRRV